MSFQDEEEDHAAHRKSEADRDTARRKFADSAGKLVIVYDQIEDVLHATACRLDAQKRMSGIGDAQKDKAWVDYEDGIKREMRIIGHDEGAINQTLILAKQVYDNGIQDLSLIHI